MSCSGVNCIYDVKMNMIVPCPVTVMSQSWLTVQEKVALQGNALTSRHKERKFQGVLKTSRGKVSSVRDQTLDAASKASPEQDWNWKETKILKPRKHACPWFFSPVCGLMCVSPLEGELAFILWSQLRLAMQMTLGERIHWLKFALGWK